jgi:uncharacterized protein YndB with AHSA1/START domain
MYPDSLVVELDVNAPVERAFRLWTAQTGLWWPKDHTISGDPDSVAFEPFVGGRIFERAPSGEQYVWGRVTAWDEPTRLEFSWHLFFDESQATHVSVTFDAVGQSTHIRLENSGFATLAEAGQVRRERTGNVWSHIVDTFKRAAEAESHT